MSVRPEEVPTRRANLYRVLLERDSALAPWLKADSGEIRAIYGIGFRMISEGRRVLAGDDLAVWVRQELEAQHIQDATAGRAIVTALQRSRMFTQEQEQTMPGMTRAVVGFRHELVGKYLAACHLLSLVGQAPDQRQIELIALSKEAHWFDVFCFIIDRTNTRTILNRFLQELLSTQSPLGRRLVAYAIDTKPPTLIDSEVRDAYLVAMVRADLHQTLTV